MELREQPEGAEQLVRARHDEVEGEGPAAARLLKHVQVGAVQGQRQALPPVEAHLVRIRVRVRARARARARARIRP